MRREAYEELSRLPDEIEKLSQQRRNVREELRSTLVRYLESLDQFSDDEEDIKRYEYDELFQKIDLSEDDLPVADEELQEVVDELDDISMDLPLPETEEFLDDDDDLKNKLDQGGVAYLSDP